jgi:hypothetical protein
VQSEGGGAIGGGGGSSGRTISSCAGGSGEQPWYRPIYSYVTAMLGQVQQVLAGDAISCWR